MFWGGWAGWGLVTVQAVGVTNNMLAYNDPSGALVKGNGSKKGHVDDLHPASSHSWLDSRESCRFATDTSVMTRESASGSVMAA